MKAWKQTSAAKPFCYWIPVNQWSMLEHSIWTALILGLLQPFQITIEKWNQSHSTNKSAASPFWCNWRSALAILGSKDRGKSQSSLKPQPRPAARAMSQHKQNKPFSKVVAQSRSKWYLIKIDAVLISRGFGIIMLLPNWFAFIWLEIIQVQ